MRRRLRTPTALAWRLHRGTLAAWTAGFVAFGLLIGAVARTAADLFTGNQQLAEVLQRLGGKTDPADAYLATGYAVLGLAAAGYAVAAALRMRSEETGQRLEIVLAGAVPRARWTASHLLFALLGPAVVLAAAGLRDEYRLRAGRRGRRRATAQECRRRAGAAARRLDPGEPDRRRVRRAPAAGRRRRMGRSRRAACSSGRSGRCCGSATSCSTSPRSRTCRTCPAARVTATPLVVLHSLVAAALVAVGVAAFRRRDVPTT